MPRKLMIESPDGNAPMLEQVPAESELQLQQLLKDHPDLLPLDELGLVAPAVVVGRESGLDSGRADLVLLGNGGDLALVEFKTGPQNPEFRAALAQLLDYGSHLWGMTVEDFESRVVQSYFNGPHRPADTGPLADVLARAWPPTTDDPVDWRQRLQAQLRDGTFHYVVAAQRFTPAMLRTLDYLNATMRSRFSAVEVIRFAGANKSAFEARFIAGARPVRAPSGTGTTNLAGVDDFLELVTDEEYRHHLQDLFEGLATVEGLTIYWGTTGCSLRVNRPNYGLLSIGWVFPPGPPRWMGLTDLTLGWYEDAKGLNISDEARAALRAYHASLEQIGGGAELTKAAIRGRTFDQAAVSAHTAEIENTVRGVVAALLET